MTKVISRKDLYKGNFENARVTDPTEPKNKSLEGFAEAMYYYYKEQEDGNKERDI